LKDFSLPKEIRLRKRAEYVTLSKQGKPIYSDYFLAIVCDRSNQHNRIGITVSKKVGNAVARNRIKRLIREYFRHRKHSIPGTRDINIIARKGLTSLSNRQITERLDKLFTKIALARMND
jgi:ribonuclease P protein component